MLLRILSGMHRRAGKADSGKHSLFQIQFPACLMMPGSLLGDAALSDGFLLLCSKCKKYKYPWVFLEDCPCKFLLGVKEFIKGFLQWRSPE